MRFFYVSGDKEYTIGKVEDSNYSYSVNNLESDDVHLLSTAACYNELRIARKGNRLYYYVNGVELYNQAFPDFYGNDFGYVWNGTQTILVDYLEVNYLD